MGPELRRHWVDMVFASIELTAAAKLVLLALETFADYKTGGNAHPGEENLAVKTCLSTRAVRAAMRQARDLGMIVQTAAANPKAHRAAVWRLTFPDDRDGSTGTTVPVESSTTGTTVPVETVSTGTGMPVETGSTGTDEHFNRNGHVVSTGTTVPPTLPTPSLNTTEISGLPGVGGTYVAANDPRPHCPQHPVNGDDPCRKCKRRQDWDDAHPGWRERDEVARKRQLREIAENCPVCKGSHWIPNTEPAVRCTHNLQEAKRG